MDFGLPRLVTVARGVLGCFTMRWLQLTGLLAVRQVRGDTPSCPNKFGVSAFSATEAATERQNFWKKFWKSKIFVCEVVGR